MKKLKSEDTTYSKSLKFVTRGTLLYFVGKGAGSVLQFLYQVILARVIGAELLGIYYIGLAVSNILRACFTFGLAHTMRHFVPRAKGPDEINTLTSGASQVSLYISIPISIFLIVFFYFYGEHIFKIVNVSSVLTLFICAAIFLSLMTIRLSSMQGQKIIWPSILIEEISLPASRILIFLILFVLGYKLFGAITAYLIASITSFILVYNAYRKCTPKAESHSKSYPSHKKLISFSWPISISIIVNTLMIWVGTLILGKFNPSKDVAIYTASARIVTFFSLFFVALNTILAPVASEYFHMNNQKELNKLYKTIIFFLIGITLPLFLVIGLFPQSILSIFGSEFQIGSSCLLILLTSQLINYLLGSSGTMLIMCGRQRTLTIIVIASAILSLILNLLFIPLLGIVGAAIASAISFSIFNFTQSIFLYFHKKIQPFSLRVFSLIIIGGILLFCYSITKDATILSIKSIVQIISITTIPFLCFLILVTNGKPSKIMSIFSTRKYFAELHQLITHSGNNNK